MTATVKRLRVRNRPQEFDVDPVKSAKLAGLFYVHHIGPGLTRELGQNGTVVYKDAEGNPVSDDTTLERVGALVIPPAWTDVWINPSPRGHLQAIGRDAKGRKQYRYHALYRDIRNQTKFSRLPSFARALPRLREHVQADLDRTGLPKEKVLATVVRLLETTCIRVGNEEYARDNKSYGLTTMRNRHAKVDGSDVRFRFKGKSGQHHDCSVRDRKVARVIRSLQDVPGYELFQYVDESGEPVKISSGDVNDYLRDATGEEFTAKDFRTWEGTLHTAIALHELGPADSDTAAKRSITAAIKVAASRLGNLPATCRSYYVHPAVLDAYVDGTLFTTMSQEVTTGDEASARFGLSGEEQAVLALVEAGTPSGAGALQRLFGPAKKAKKAA